MVIKPFVSVLATLVLWLVANRPGIFQCNAFYVGCAKETLIFVYII